MPLSPEQKRTIVEAIASVLEVDPAEIKEDTNFQEDLGVDSLGAIEILVEMERRFNIVIEPEELVNMTTLAGVFATVERILRTKELEAS